MEARIKEPNRSWNTPQNLASDGQRTLVTALLARGVTGNNYVVAIIRYIRNDINSLKTIQ